MWLQIDGTWLFAAPNLLSGCCFGAKADSGSSLNSFAFRRTIDPLTAIPMQNQANSYAWCKTKWEGTIERLKIWHVLNLFWHLWKLANESLSYTMLSHDTTIVLRVTHSTTHTHSAISWLIYFVWPCFCCFKIRNQCSTKNLPWVLCSVNHSSILWSSSGYFGVKHPIVFRFADNLISPLKRFAWSFLQRRTRNSLMPTAFASATVVSLSARLYGVRRALGMMTTWLEIYDCEHEIVW